MTVENQLRELARHADQHQRVITADEIVQAARHDVTSLAEHSGSEDGSESTRPRPPDDLDAGRRGRQWILVAAAAIVVVVLGLLVMDARDGHDRVRTVTVPPAPAPFGDIPSGSIAFAADAAGGDALTRSPSHGAVENRPAGMDIYITSEGGSARRLAATNAHERCPAFSPDGQRLAYLELPMSRASLAPSLVVVRVNAADDSSSPELRVPVPASEVYGLRSFAVPCPQWSPDGSRLAYLAYPTGPQPGTGGVLELLAELRVVTLDGDERVVDSGRPAHPGPFAWSPDGDAIAYAAADGVWAAPLDGSAPSLVWRTEGTPTAVSWSSRGELAVTVLTMVAVEGGSQDVFSVHIVDVDGGSAQLPDASHRYEYGPAWSPDGSRLASVGDDGHIRLSDRDDGSTAALSPPQENGRQIAFQDVAWSPDGEQLLALARSEDEGYALVSVSTDGASSEVLTPWSWAFDWTNLGDVSWQPTTT